MSRAIDDWKQINEQIAKLPSNMLFGALRVYARCTSICRFAFGCTIVHIQKSYIFSSVFSPLKIITLT